jgi:hypothetical protein
MKSIKKMLLGIAFLIISAIGAIFWAFGSVIGAVMFFGGLAVGILLCIDGFLSVD